MASTNCKKESAQSTRAAPLMWEKIWLWVCGTGASLRRINSDRRARWSDFSLWGAVSGPTIVKKMGRLRRRSNIMTRTWRESSWTGSPSAQQILSSAQFTKDPCQRSRHALAQITPEGPSLLPLCNEEQSEMNVTQRKKQSQSVRLGDEMNRHGCRSGSRWLIDL